jgi:hypothetical protein
MKKAGREQHLVGLQSKGTLLKNLEYVMKNMHKISNFAAQSFSAYGFQALSCKKTVVSKMTQVFEYSHDTVIFLSKQKLYALCPLPFALCPMLYALCPLPFALCPLPSALCPLPSALCPLPP